MTTLKGSSRKLEAILFADITGYTAMMQRNEVIAASILRRFQELMREKVPVFNGRIVNEMGDGMLCTFSSSKDAVMCALELQKKFNSDLEVPVRIGCHSGAVVYEDHKVYGDSINVASRIESMGISGAILVSEQVRSQIKNLPEIQLKSLGKFNFKNIDEELEVFAVANDGIVVPERKQLQGKFDQKISSGRVVLLAVTTLVVLAGGFLLANRFFNLTGNTLPLLDAKSIAVLPFNNMSSLEDAYFASGISEDILTQISKIEDLKVISRITLREYDSKGKTPNEIGNELKVAHLLAGSIRRAGTELRITCQLINTDDQTESWAQTFDRQFENIFEIQSEVAQKVAVELKAELTENERVMIERKPTSNLTAYSHFLKGRDIFNGNNGKANEKAIEQFKLAISLDPTFSQAWSSLSNAYSLAVYSYGNRPYHYLDTALLFAQRATEINPNETEGWYAIGMAYDVKGQYELATRMYKKALNINPNDAGTISNLAILLNVKGELVESIKLQKRSIELEPIASNRYIGLANSYARLEMFDEAFEQLELALAIDPESWIARYYLGYTHILSGNPDKAEPFIESMVQLDPGNARFLEIAGELTHYYNPDKSKDYFEQALRSDVYDENINIFTPAGIGYHLWREGKIDSANVWFEAALQRHLNLIEEGSEDRNNQMFIATIYGIRGEHQKALKMLKEVSSTSFDIKSWEISPMSAELAKEPGFIELWKETKSKIQAMRAEVIENERLERDRRLLD